MFWPSWELQLAVFSACVCATSSSKLTSTVAPLVSTLRF